MTKHLFFAFSLSALVLGCSDTTATGQFTSAVTGESCEPNVEEIQSVEEKPKKSKEYCGAKSNNGHGNNEDGVDSSNPGNGSGGPNGETDQSCDGTGDCIDDEINHGPGAEEEECELPTGCDESLCCDDDDGDDDDGDDDGDDDDTQPPSSDDTKPTYEGGDLIALPPSEHDDGQDSPQID